MIRAVPAALAALLFSPAVLAQQYPAKPVRVVLTISGGGETNARVVMERMTAQLGQPFVVDAQPGAGGAVGATTVARSAPDGYTLLYATNSSMTLRRYLVKDLPYDVLRDFIPVGKVGEATSAVAARIDLPAKTIAEFIEYARKNPGKATYGTPGIGTSHHLSGVMLEQLTGISLVHVPYKNAPQTVIDLSTGRIDTVFTTMSTFVPFVEAGKIRIIAINGPKRYDAMPNVPTINEVLPGFERPQAWIALFAPTGTAAPIVRRLSDELVKAAGHPEVRAKMASLGTMADPQSSEQFGAFLKRDVEAVGRMMKAARVQPE